MPDAYLPALDAFMLDEDEVSAVAMAMETDDPWGWKPDEEATTAALKSAKDKVLAYHLERHNGNCCYCRMNLNGAGPFVTDREHILPKGKAAFKPYSYTMWNLAASCKRCNMQFKRSGDDFVIDKADEAAFKSSGNYRLIHPNFDVYEDHIKRVGAQAGTLNIVAFVRAPDSAKAAYTYEFFKLGEMLVDRFDEAQGLAVHRPEGELAQAVKKLIDEFQQ